GFVAIFPWTLATIQLVRARRTGVAIAGTLLVVSVAAIGYGTLASINGFDAYVRAVRDHADYVRRADSYDNAIRPSLLEVIRMQLDPYDAGKASLLLNVLALLGIVFGRRRTVAEVLLTFTPFFVFCMFAVNPLGANRFSLNYMAGVVLLAVEGTDALARFASRIPHARLLAHASVLLLLLGRLVTWVLPAFEWPRKSEAPAAQAMLWLREHVPPSSTIFTDGSWPWPRYYLPHHRNVSVGDPGNVLGQKDATNGWYFSVGATNAKGAVEFYRPRNRTWNIVTKRGFEAYVQPAAQVMRFTYGWYGPENDGPDVWRWMQQHGQILLGPQPRRAELRLRFDVPIDAYDHPVTVRFTLNGRELGTLVAKQHNNVVRYVVDGMGRVQDLRIDLSHAFVPAQRGHHDPRTLGLMLREWSWNSAE
ncbi:MAG: hypothetical protein ACLGH0_05955, partial [Thermoanaerobaculia bacterium]